MSRKHNDFIDGFMKYTENSESHERIRLWSAIACVASSLERRNFLNWGHTVVYPNLYTIVIAPSGARKAEPLSIARDLLKASGTKLAPERITDEALLRYIAQSIDNFTDSSGNIKFQSAVTIVGEELSVLLRNRDVGFMADLTNLYDCRDAWEYRTKGSGADELHGGCLNILASSAPDWLPFILPTEAVGGGFTSRCFFVVVNAKGKIVPDPNIGMPSEEERHNLIYDLEKIRHLCGEYRLSKTAYDFYIQWYETSEKAMQEGNMPIDDPKLSNYASRRATHLRKLSMIMCASRSDSFIIQDKDIKRALSIMENNEDTMPQAFKTVGRSPLAAITEEVIEILKSKKKIEKSALLRCMRRDLDYGEFSQLELSLEAMGIIKKCLEPRKGTVTYIYKG